MNRDEVRAAALALPEEDRVALAHELLGDLDLDDDVARAWSEEIPARLSDIDEGRVTPIPAEQVFEALRARADLRRARRAGCVSPARGG